eukprot:6508364-Prymnesium_polylepis.1
MKSVINGFDIDSAPDACVASARGRAPHPHAPHLSRRSAGATAVWHPGVLAGAARIHRVDGGSVASGAADD